MTKELIIDILIAICIAGVTLAGILYFLSYDSYDKDVDRRLKESERKNEKGKWNLSRYTEDIKPLKSLSRDIMEA